MNILIIEDELAAANKLRRLIQQEFPDVTVYGPLESIDDSVDWLQQHGSPDLIFMDIQLADGPSFEIFSEASIQCPVIFTTAYDQHALQAFRHNGIEYLLKPIKQAEFQQAATKYRRWIQDSSAGQVNLQALMQDLVNHQEQQYQKRLVIRYGQQIKALDISDAAYFFIESKVTIFHSFSGKTYPVDQNLEELQALLNPEEFFRINRKMIVHIHAIQSMSAHSKSRVRLQLQPPFEDEVIVSAERSPDFKEWLKGLPL